MATTYEYTATLSIIECAGCGMDFGVTPKFQRQRRNDHETFYCPAGHGNHYPQKSEAEKLRAKAELAERSAARERARRDQAEADAAHQKAVARGYKGALAKTKKRIGKGVCPCCNRHFPDVEAHMASKHPDMVGES